MKLAVATIGANCVSLACVTVAGWLAAHDKDGWGWFLLVGLLCIQSVKLKGDAAK